MTVRSQQPSVFTQAIVKGLRTGAADRNADGEIDANARTFGRAARQHLEGVDETPPVAASNPAYPPDCAGLGGSRMLYRAIASAPDHAEWQDRGQACRTVGLQQ